MLVISSVHGQRPKFLMPCRRAQKRYREKKLQEVDQYKLQVILTLSSPCQDC